MEECNSKMTRYNCSLIGSFYNKCAHMCDWNNGLYSRECAMDYKCTIKQRECKQQKGQECEFHCCEGNLCNDHPCNLGHNIRPLAKGIVGLALFLLLNFS